MLCVYFAMHVFRHFSYSYIYIYIYLIDKKEDILERTAKKAAQGIQKVYSYH